MTSPQNSLNFSLLYILEFFHDFKDATNFVWMGENRNEQRTFVPHTLGCVFVHSDERSALGSTLWEDQHLKQSVRVWVAQGE